MRLDKYLSHLGLGSRRDIKELLKRETVLVNGKRIKNGQFQVAEEGDHVSFNGELLNYQTYFYWLLHKPTGVISATEDASQATVLTLFKDADYRSDLFPVGRLDKDTTGLLLITNDGELAHQLLSPKKHVPKVYLADIAGVMDSTDQAAFQGGITLKDGTVCGAAELEILATDEQAQTSQIRLRIVEGKYHQVKRMVAAVGKKVVKLHRQEMGPLELPADLAAGSYRALTAAEIDALETYHSRE